MAADREGPPFLLRLFYRTGAFHRPDEFTTTSHLPKHISVYTWPSCTLAELSHHLAAASPPLLPDPAVGTRLSFRLIFADTRGNANQPPKYTVKDLGSLVIGGSGLGITDSEDEEAQEAPGDGDAFKTLGDSKLVVGDYVSVAILPPDTVTGAIAASGDARTGRGAGIGEARSSMGTMPPPFRDGPSQGFARGRGGGRGAPRGRGSGPGRWREGGDALLDGEWRRGERLPEPPMGRGRGRDRGRDRDRDRDWERPRW